MDTIEANPKVKDVLPLGIVRLKRQINKHPNQPNYSDHCLIDINGNTNSIVQKSSNGCNSVITKEDYVFVQLCWNAARNKTSIPFQYLQGDNFSDKPEVLDFINSAEKYYDASSTDKPNDMYYLKMHTLYDHPLPHTATACETEYMTAIKNISEYLKKL